MSCEDKHNNFDSKFCPECGLKLEHQAKYVEELNEMFDDFQKTMMKYGIENGPYIFVESLYRRKLQLKYQVFLILDKFYTKEQALNLLNCDAAILDLDLVPNIFVYYYDQKFAMYMPGSIEGGVKIFEKYKKKITIKQKIVELVKEYLGSNYNNVSERGKIIKILDSIDKNTCIDKEKMKTMIGKYLDEFY